MTRYCSPIANFFQRWQRLDPCFGERVLLSDLVRRCVERLKWQTAGSVWATDHVVPQKGFPRRTAVIVLLSAGQRETIAVVNVVPTVLPTIQTANNSLAAQPFSI